jgi:hypothetical protein
MRYQALLLAMLTALAHGKATLSGPDELHVMLQGASPVDLAALVESKGGSITHELHIIDAVGATVTQEQLDQVLASPLVTRHIDDLLVKEHEEDAQQESPGCDVGAALELQFDHTGISWTLYNKLAQPASLQTLVFSWPALLGPVASVALGDNQLAPSSYEQPSSGSLHLTLDKPQTVSLAGTADLRIKFKPAATINPDLPLRQRDFAITAEFHGDCSAKLIPGYENNDENFHYTVIAGADALHTHGITGKGVTVAVVDSGLWEHPALATDTAGASRIIARYDAIANSANVEAFDESGHGTHMTSIIAHSGALSRNGLATGSFKGVAPDVNLVAVKAFDVEGQGDLLDIVRAIQWVVDNRERYNIRVLNLSFAARPRWNYWEDPINQAVMRAWASGITVVAAAGNEGPGDMTIGSPGNLPYIITVGAITDSWTPDTRDDDYIPDFSSRGPTPNAHIKPDIVAPGGHMAGVTRPGSTLTRDHPEYQMQNGDFVMTGSSQASALVSGIAALLLQLQPELSPDEIKCKLTSSAQPAINRDGLLAYSPFQQGQGQVSANRAVTLGATECGNSDLDIHKDMMGLEHFQGPAIVDQDGSVSLPGLADMLSPLPSAQGMSDTRKWGIKDHIERNPPLAESAADGPGTPFDWQKMYFMEKAKIEELAQQPPAGNRQP